jgi:7-carboxy-7-deazaguanine synthase
MKILRVNSIFSSINGEACNRHQGSLCTFIRLQGCNLRCQYPCDTPGSQEIKAGKKMTIDQIIRKVNKLKNVNVTITGGEPLLQSDGLIDLVAALRHNHYISIETNGSIRIPYWESVTWVADYKLPSSRMEGNMNINNYQQLTCCDLIKFVITDRKDFDRAMELISLFLLYEIKVNFVFSPSSGSIESAEMLVKWMLEKPILKKEGAVLSLQLHKIIGVS